MLVVALVVLSLALVCLQALATEQALKGKPGEQAWKETAITPKNSSL